MTERKHPPIVTARSALPWLVIGLLVLGLAGCATPPGAADPAETPQSSPPPPPPAAGSQSQEAQTGAPASQSTAGTEAAGNEAARPGGDTQATDGETGEDGATAGDAQGSPASVPANPAGAEAQVGQVATTDGETGEDGATAGDAQGSPASAPAGPAGADAPGGQVPATSGPAAGARDGDLEGQFEDSLGSFDGLLLSEQARIAGQRQRVPESASPGGSSSRAGQPPAMPPAGLGAAPADQGMPGEGGGAIDGSAGQAPGSGGGAGADIEIPADVGSGDDDDIVARQLREAAMNEKDPVLREKLWDEYRNYRQGIGR